MYIYIYTHTHMHIYIIAVAEVSNIQHSLQMDNLPHPGYDPKLHLMVRLHFWRSGEYGVHLHCHYFKVQSYPICL